MAYEARFRSVKGVSQRAHQTKNHWKEWNNVPAEGSYQFTLQVNQKKQSNKAKQKVEFVVRLGYSSEPLQKKPSISHVGFLCFLGETLLMLFWFSCC